MALVVGVDRGFITREQGLERLTQILDFPGKLPAITASGPTSEWKHGAEYVGVRHVRYGGDLVETSFLMEGLLAARQYFKATAKPSKVSIRGLPSSGKPWSGIGTPDLTK